GAANSVESLDQLIKEQATHWRLDRMAAVDRNILRLALYELTHYPENPPAVVINESLELARRFSQGGSVEFVNGVLDAVRKSLPPAHG
ncbi:MAG: transcription antitermination factor NusB, partial [Candidatus Dormibacteraceae bacterium]